MRKGITDLISVIILLLITVALAGVAYSFLQGYLFPLTKTFQISPGGAYCSSTGSGGSAVKTIYVYVTNTAYQSQLTDEDFQIRAIDGNQLSAAAASPGTSTGLQNINLDSGVSGKLIDMTCSSTTACTVGSSGTCCRDTDPVASGNQYAGSHTLDLGTTAIVQHISVFCP